MNPDARRVPPRTIYLVAVLAVCLILCLSLTICLVASPRPPRLVMPPVAVSAEAAQSGEDKVMAVADAPLGSFRVDITQEEATSLLALRVPESPVLHPQIVFTDGNAYISGVLDIGVSLKVMSMWSVQDSGHPHILLDRASIGPFAMPSIMLNSVSSTINEMIAESGTGIMPTAIQIENGHIIVDGTKSPPTVP